MSDTSSARLDPIAAPVMPIAGRPKWPKISIQLNKMFEATMTIELKVNVLVCVVPTYNARNIAVAKANTMPGNRHLT